MSAVRMSFNSAFVMIVALGFVVLPGCGGGGGDGGGGGTGTTDTTKPSIASVTISTPVATSPNPVSISADVTDNQGVTSVTATISPTSVLKPLQASVVSLTKGAGNTWSVSDVQFKGNSTTSDVAFTVTIEASDAAANTSSDNSSSAIPTALPPASP